MTRDLYDLYRRELARKLKTTWRLEAHPRVNLFIWKVAWGHLSTKVMLRARGWTSHFSIPIVGWMMR